MNVRYPSLPRDSTTIQLFVLLSISFQLSFVFLFVDSVVTTGLLSDDIYYYLSLAQNFVQGNGIVFNLGSPTNGFHPLYFVVSTISYVLLRPYGENVPVLGLLTVSILAHGATGFFVYLSVRKLWNSLMGIVSSFFWLFHPAIIMIVFSGMEVTLQIFIISVLIYYYINYRSIDEFRFKSAIALGLLMGLAFYARMDSIFIISSIAVILTIRSAKDSGSWFQRLQSVFNRDTLTIGLTSFLSVLPWMVWSYFTVGRLTPHSGSAQSTIVLATGWGTSCPLTFSSYLCGVTHSAKRLLIRVVSPFFIPPSRVLGLKIETLIPILALVSIIIGIISLYWIRHNSFLIGKMDFLILSIVMHTFFYIFIHLHYRDYYGLFVYFILITTVIPVFFQSVSEYLFKKENFDTLFSFVAVISITILFVTAPVVAPQANTSHVLNDGADYINKEIPENTTVGVFNAGRLQYYSERDVINLDGVINIQSYRAIHNGRLDCYIYEKNINYIIDFEGSTIRLQNPSLTRAPVNFTVDDIPGPLTVIEVQSRSTKMCEAT